MKKKKKRKRSDYVWNQFLESVPYPVIPMPVSSRSSSPDRRKVHMHPVISSWNSSFPRTIPWHRRRCVSSPVFIIPTLIAWDASVSTSSRTNGVQHCKFEPSSSPFRRCCQPRIQTTPSTMTRQNYGRRRKTKP